MSSSSSSSSPPPPPPTAQHTPLASWSALPVLAAFFFIAYHVLRFVQRRLEYVHIPKLAEGQWHPIAANYRWSSGTGTGDDTESYSSSKMREEYIRLVQERRSSVGELQKALMKRTMEAVNQIREMQEQGSTLQQLVKNGSIGEEVWTRFKQAEALLNEECKSIAEEANRLKPGWGQEIFRQASQMLLIELKRRADQQRQEMDKERVAQAEWDAKHLEEDRVQREAMAKEMADELIRQEEQEKLESGNSSSTGSLNSSKKRK